MKVIVRGKEKKEINKSIKVGSRIKVKGLI